jgi:phospholipid/cholesterol/gamma-HCH transport system ATP-binding protein
MAMIEIIDLHKSFGDHHVLRGVNLTVEKGESMTVIGGSGSGKSVLIKHIIGLLFPNRGRVIVDGQDLNNLDEAGLNEVRKKFGMLFQGAALFDSLPVWENVAFGLIQAKGMDRKAAKAIALEKLAAVGLAPEVAALWPAELSGGMKKRVSLARSIAANPEIIFFDEPTTGLDPIMGDVINDLIVKCVRDLGATALSITHDMASARKIAHRIAMLWQGRIIWAGPVSEVDRSGNPYVDQFINGRAEGPITMQVGA